MTLEGFGDDFEVSLASPMGGPNKEKSFFGVSNWPWRGDVLFEGVWSPFWSPFEHGFA